MLGEIINYYTKDFQYLSEDCGLPKPDFMSIEILRVMNMCLRINTALRLTFKEICEALEDIKSFNGENISSAGSTPGTPREFAQPISRLSILST
jgi:hypothetical protein